MKELFIQIIESIVAYILLMLIGTNLIGMVVRGFFEKFPSIEAQTPELDKVIREELRREKTSSVVTTLISIVITLVYFYGLFHFWNIGLVVIAGIIMACRLPDLIWEIRHGRKMRIADMPRTFVSYSSTVILWLCLPLTWYCLFRLN